MQQTPYTAPPGARLAPLRTLHDFKVSHGEPDIRGWSVHTADGRLAGTVDELIVDTEAMKVRYMDVALNRAEMGLREDRHVRVPLADARLDDHDNEVLLGSTTAADLAAMQTLDPQSMEFGTPPRADGADRFESRDDDDVRRMTLSEEELRLDKRVTDAGEVGVRKTVESHHLSKSVPVMHEEVTIERRPISADSPATTEISEDEVRIPLRAEEAVIEKRVVPREEVVIRKRLVEGEQKIEADLRSERVDVDDQNRPQP